LRREVKGRRASIEHKIQICLQPDGFALATGPRPWELHLNMHYLNFEAWFTSRYAHFLPARFVSNHANGLVVQVLSFITKN